MCKGIVSINHKCLFLIFILFVYFFCFKTQIFDWCMYTILGRGREGPTKDRVGRFLNKMRAFGNEEEGDEEEVVEAMETLAAAERDIIGCPTVQKVDAHSISDPVTSRITRYTTMSKDRAKTSSSCVMVTQDDSLLFGRITAILLNKDRIWFRFLPFVDLQFNSRIQCFHAASGFGHPSVVCIEQCSKPLVHALLDDRVYFLNPKLTTPLDFMGSSHV